MGNNTAETIIRIMAQKDASIESATTETQKKFADTFGKIEQYSAAAGIGLGALSGTLAMLGKTFIEKADQMEIFNAKLVTVLHSTAKAREALESAREFASKAPFELRGIVDATVKLTTYGVNAKEILPTVANIAAGMGKGIEETASSIGKAWSGSAHGVMQLRSEYGITTARLKQYGAEVNSMGEINVRSEAGLEKFRQALLKIGQVEFGGAIERQMQTLMGATTNMKDAISKVETDFGERLIPIVKGITSTVTTAVTAFESIPDVFKDVIVGGGLIVGSTLAMTAAEAGVITMLAAHKKALAELNLLKEQAIKVTGAQAAANLEEAASTGAAAGANKAAGGANALKGSTSAWAGALPMLNIAALALMATYVGVTYATERFIAKEKEKELVMMEESQTLQKSGSDLRTWIDLLDEANKSSDNVSQGTHSISTSLQDLQTAIQATDIDKLRQILSASGMKPDEIIKEGKDDKDRVKTYGKQLDMLKALDKTKANKKDYYLFDKIAYADPNTQSVVWDKDSNEGQFFDYTKLKGKYSNKEIEEIKKYAKEQNISPDSITEDVKIKQLMYDRSSKKSAISEPVSQREQDLKNTLEQVQDITSKNKDYLDLSGKVKGVEGYTEKIQVLKKETESIRINLMAQNLIKPGDTIGTVLKKYNKATDIQDKSLYKEYILSLTKRNEAQKEFDENRRKGDERILDDKFTSKKRYLDDEKALDHISIDEKYKQEKDIAEKLRSVTQKGISKSSDTFNGQNVAVSGSGMYGPEDPKLEKLKHDYWTDPEVKKKVDQELLSLDKENKSALKETQSKHLNDLNEKSEEYLAASKLKNENNTAAEIEALKTTAQWYEDAMAKKVISEEEGQKKIQDLRIKTNALTKKMADEDVANQTKLTQSLIGTSDIKLKHLEKELEAGKHVESLLANEVDSRLKKELENIDLVTREKIRQSDQTTKAIQAIENDAQNSRMQAIQKQKDYLDGIIQKQKKDVEETKNALTTNTNPLQFNTVNAYGKDKSGKISPGWESLPAFNAYGNDTGEEMSTVNPVEAMAHPDKTSAFGGAGGALESTAKQYENVLDKANADLTAGVTTASSSLKLFVDAVHNATQGLSKAGSSSPIEQAGYASYGFTAASNEARNNSVAQQSQTNNQSNNSQTFLFGENAFTPSAHAQNLLNSGMAALQDMVDNGFLGQGNNSKGKLSY